MKNQRTKILQNKFIWPIARPTEVTWRPGQETSLAPQILKRRTFGSKWKYLRHCWHISTPLQWFDDLLIMALPLPFTLGRPWFIEIWKPLYCLHNWLAPQTRAVEPESRFQAPAIRLWLHHL